MEARELTPPEQQGKMGSGHRQRPSAARHFSTALIRPQLEGDVVALDPLDELERPCADGVARGVGGLDRLLVHDLGVVRQVRQEWAERGLEVEGDLGLAPRLVLIVS
jgi:hypothetical protein